MQCPGRRSRQLGSYVPRCHHHDVSATLLPALASTYPGSARKSSRDRETPQHPDDQAAAQVRAVADSAHPGCGHCRPGPGDAASLPIRTKHSRLSSPHLANHSWPPAQPKLHPTPSRSVQGQSSAAPMPPRAPGNEPAAHVQQCPAERSVERSRFCCDPRCPRSPTRKDSAV